MMRLTVMLALVMSAFVSTSYAQGRASSSLTSEDLLGKPTAYAPQSAPASARISASSSNDTTARGGLYRDPSGAFSLNLPSGDWRVITKSLDKGKLSDLRVFRKVDDEGFAMATASVYMISASASLSVERAARLDAGVQRALAEALTSRFLSSNASIVTVNADASQGSSNFQVIADQLVSRRAVVRALITAIEHDGKLYVVVCRAPLEAFDVQAREFSAITQSLVSSVARSS